ncbi:ABC transporter substrate-binding protein [Streptomyces sp. 3MP-14]|uniref:ABC transporter substrate-binding protein n=1 Tax=Streptomyces mimosae TaxID=2586635 RepID=A0A5N5ZQU0_9ACTN|nr:MULTISPECIES: iron-siderophore ABC transporter substrate-binding protein [Streptomyces]KAB8158877.1 ABC transporter substrate-binding protein [Streptomyces mimosae]KAB8174883.1 ABC transporter substrate-binding protein [Streptomyces sp. 3MP-14]
MRSHRLPLLAVAAVLLGLTACGGSSDDNSDGADSAGNANSAAFPRTIEHALGETTIESAPQRVATVNWANHEVPLALGVVPVGMAAANFGDDDGDGVLPWVAERLTELDAETPVLFDETDGIDFEAVADTEPDVILAAYSGLTQQDYDTLSEIAPTVAYPDAPWATPWREIIQLNSQALGLDAEADALITDIEDEIAATVADYPQLEGKSAMFMTHVDPNDVSEVGFYTTHDTRTLFFEDLGLTIPESIATASEGTDQFALTQSAERIDAFDDVDIITGYGDETGELLDVLRNDPLLSRIPAVERDSVYLLPGSTPLATAANPTPLSISWVLEDYVAALAEAADRVE